MNAADSTDLQKLTAAVATLNEALVASNRRTALLERMVRWGAIGLVAVAAITVMVVNEAIDHAYASETQNVQQSADSVIGELKALNQNLQVFGQLGQLANAGFQEAAQKDDIQKAVQRYKDEHPGATDQQALLALAGGVMADVFVVMHRIGEDSNLIHPMLSQQNMTQAMQSVSRELQLMNGALSAIPYMAANMGVMGNSMGKMGSWMPWAP